MAEDGTSTWPGPEKLSGHERPGKEGDPGARADADPFELERFVTAQEAAGAYERALAELRRGAKRSHWIWFVFPQLAGLGHSETSRRYAISGPAEAAAYLAHPLLGPRLKQCCVAMLELDTRDPEQVLGAVDALKLHSSMTLFARAAGAREGVFDRMLYAFYEGVPDAVTERLLRRG